MGAATLILLFVSGLMAGWLGSVVMSSGRGTAGDLLVGTMGALAGGTLFTILGQAEGAGILGVSATALIGAIVVLALRRRRRSYWPDPRTA